MPKDKRAKSSQEREVLIALTLLYVLIIGAVLAIHYTQLHLGTASPPPLTKGQRP